MHEIVSRLRKFDCLSVDIFDEDVIINKSVDQWPHCDVLISFHSVGFPFVGEFLFLGPYPRSVSGVDRDFFCFPLHQSGVKLFGARNVDVVGLEPAHSRQHAQPNESLIVKTVVNPKGEIKYNFKKTNDDTWG